MILIGQEYTRGKYVSIFHGEDAKNDEKIAFSRYLDVVHYTGMVALAMLIGFTAY